MNFIQQFTQELERPHPAPERLALAIAGMAYPELDMAACLQEIDDLAEGMQRGLSGARPGRARAQRFLDVLNREQGFSGNRENYYDPANSFLNVVLRQRRGLPILLSLLCIAIGRRIGERVEGVGFPGHFMARYQDSAGAWLLDPFNGAVVECTEADAYLARIFQRPLTLPADTQEAVSAAALAQRILNNLRNVYLSRGDDAMAVRVLDYLLVLQPQNEEFWQQRGVLHFRNQDWERTAYDLKRYFFLRSERQPDWKLERLAAGSLQPDQQLLELLTMLRRAEEARQRMN